MRKMWHVWPGQWWPMSPTQEQLFIAEIEAHTKGVASARVDRDDVTALLNALRCGTDFATLLTVAPGCKPERLLGAHRLLNRQRLQSEQAWYAIEEDPTPATLHAFAAHAARLLPIPVHRILSAREHALHERVTEAIAEATSEVHRCRVLAKGFEAELEQHVPGSVTGVDLGAKLYNPMNPGVYGNAFFLADRVSSLSPVRVADLLGETRTTIDHAVE